ncbi:MAG: PTS N-acetyl-D-glucosamine transporter [Sphingomonas sp. SCN 67-18]|uniref:N-acetylglucosamine-specific PTS transporter subunit IIBC n=1 Tax=uncultured Sphingomonas sp. TaxID=158754 RepID=UPI00086C971B|nr:N-acetylglucosamine-specific PTS transporter subunit IIBC [Sphingomonas sp. SCN 67-18]ODU22552.1 MAG: PTS N-acetyl-D-glucosamine transporter [Sphingomonas sp. SCN 67-18]
MSRWSAPLEKLQPLGRALMLPIAVLPIAALLLRLGQPDMLDIAFVAAAGDAIFSNLGLIFAAGVSVGLARENHGAAALAGVVCYLVATEGAKALLAVPPAATAAFADTAARDLAANAWKAREIAKLSVPAGIISGLTAGALYNRFAEIRLPAYLGFFAGRRFVPIAAGIVGIAFAAAFGLGFPWFEAGVDALSRWVVGAGSAGLFAYGLLNRLLLVTGLHHILNNLAWFLLGDFQGATGDLKRFFAGDPTAGAFMAGFFPVMMFGLPAACLAMYRAAAPERRKAVGGLFLSLALTSFLTGVTEPIEFTFLFLAPLLFLVHAILTGLAMVIMAALDVKLGFGFSAGLFDYLLNFGLATRPLLLLPVGLAYALVYYAAFAWCIRRFDLKTPGRDGVEAAAAPGHVQGRDGDGAAIVAALGGAGNLQSIDACTTRLRLTLADPEKIDEAALRAAGARGVIHVGQNGLQVVMGPQADQIASAMRRSTAVASAATGETPAAAHAQSTDDLPDDPAVTALAALLKPAKVQTVEMAGGRIILSCRHPDAISADALATAGIRAVATVPGGLHLLTARDDRMLGLKLRRALARMEGPAES